MTSKGTNKMSKNLKYTCDKEMDLSPNEKYVRHAQMLSAQGTDQHYYKDTKPFSILAHGVILFSA